MNAAGIDLSGLWRVAPITAALHRTGADLDLDDSKWDQLDVPGHWAESPAFSDFSGRLLYRRRFDNAELSTDSGDGSRHWLTLEGIIDSAEIWLDGTYIGDTVGYFAAHKFEVTDQLANQNEHLLAIETHCGSQTDRRDKTVLTGSLQTGSLAPSNCPGGVWRPVSIRPTGPVAIQQARLLCQSATEKTAELQVRLVVDATEATSVRIGTSVVGPDGSAAGGGNETHTLAAGENRLEWSVQIDQPDLWWPASLGAQPLYDVAVSITDHDGTTSDRRHWRTGLRSVDEKDLVFSINGERIFAKSIAYGPPGPLLGAVSEQRLRDDVRRAQEAGLDMLRVYGHVGRHETYEEADKLGLLIWQDLPLVGGYSSKVRGRARQMARSIVDELGHHPSILTWSAHCEPNGQINAEPLPADTPDSLLVNGLRVGRHFLPTWNRSVLDTIIGRELRSADASRPVVARSGSLPSPGDVSGSDTHLWLGWHGGQGEDLAELLRLWPRLGAFPGGIGTQSVTFRDWASDEPTWATAERGAFERYLPRQAYADGNGWASATQAYQADALRVQIETLRRLKYIPTGGFCIMALADAEPQGGFGILDYDRQPKPAHNVVVDACRPVVIISDVPPSVVIPGEPVSLDIHAVNDLHRPLGTVRVRATAHLGAWEHKIVWEGKLASDICLRVGSMQFVTPPLHGRLTLDLELESADLVVTNRYQTVVIPEAEL